MNLSIELLEVLAAVLAVIHILGFFSALDALYWTRTPQGALAWSLALVLFPYGALPLYWTFRSRSIAGYRKTVDSFLKRLPPQLEKFRHAFKEFVSSSVPINPAIERVLEAIAGAEFSDYNKLDLLIDGEATFNSIFQSINEAEHYILIEFFIVKDDRIGNQLRELLIKASKRGVKILFLFDEVGSKKLSSSYIDSLREAGVQIRPFGTRQGLHNFFQFNLRNHRKTVVVDGMVAFVGGHNVGDEYLGRSPRFRHWRDTHVRIEGPAVIPIEGYFMSDWLWASREFPELAWKLPKRNGGMRVLPVATGPSEDEERCGLLFSELIRCANKRLWIASPYFVPDDAILRDLQLAALRGVDVRILLPQNPDHYLVWLASLFYVPEVARFGVKVFRYRDGFLHQKAFLVDDVLSGVGTANLDNRSFRLNFEMTIVVADPDFNKQIESMFEKDFSNSELDELRDWTKLPLNKRLLSRFARLFAPIL